MCLLVCSCKDESGSSINCVVSSLGRCNSRYWLVTKTQHSTVNNNNNNSSSSSSSTSN